MKVLLAATHPQQCTGYARVGTALANGLAARGIEVLYFGYQNLAGAANRDLDLRVKVVDVAMTVTDGDRASFGFDLLPKVVEVESPDVVLLYNDLLVLNAFLDSLGSYFTSGKKFKTVCYVDLVHDREDSGLLGTVNSRSDALLVFTEHWKRALAEEYHVDLTKISVVPHGLDPWLVGSDRAEARQRLGLPKDAFVVLNSNRNSYRKALDVTIRSFLDFYKEAGAPDDAKLFLNCNAACDTGYDIPRTISNECRRLGLDTQRVGESVILGMASAGFASDATVADLYAASDCGMNTCVGEGFGLCNMEHAAKGKPQLVTATGGLRDIFGSDAIPPIARLDLCRGFVAHGGSMDVPDAKEFSKRLTELYRRFKDTGSAGSERDRVRADLFKMRYAWGPILDDLAGFLGKVAKGKLPTLKALDTIPESPEHSELDSLD